MAETINLKKRLIGREDINFDISGTNETEYFFTADGSRKPLSKINASHFPLTVESRKKLNATNVEEALNVLSDKTDNFKTADVMSEDVTINFLPEDDAETIQNKINQQKKNLNGYTLTFLFPASVAQNLYETITFQDFFNGTVIIAGESTVNRVSVYDRLDINSLFRIYRCFCEVKIEYFYFIHQFSQYAVSAENSPSVAISNSLFSGVKDADSYAVNKIVSNVALVNCEFADDMEFFPPEGNTNTSSSTGKYIGEIFAYPGAVAPEGAYSLRGQTIQGCDSLYPQFWEWLNTARIRTVTTEQYEKELSETGVCGGFVINSVSGSVRLPHIVNGTLWGSDGSTIGASVGAGLPNITGSFSLGPAAAANADGAFYNTNADISGSGDWDTDKKVNFDASRSSSIYGNSETVQPPAIRVNWCIQVFNAATALSKQESAQLASKMQTKAQTDLANVDSNIDYVVESWRAEDGSSWYRKYRSGWIEQGGSLFISNYNDMTFATPFSAIPPTVFAQPRDTAGDSGSNIIALPTLITATGCKIYCRDSNSEAARAENVSWFACGF
jgi:hypothetical protein